MAYIGIYKRIINCKLFILKTYVFNIKLPCYARKQ